MASEPIPGRAGLTRRQLLARAAGAGALAASATAFPPSLRRVLAQPPLTGHLEDIEHVVIVIQENRSFDHYFGTYPGVRGFDDRSILQPDGSTVYAQRFAQNDPSRRLLPFHIDTSVDPSLMRPGECVPDPEHQWLMQHECWDGGAMDRWVSQHIAVNGDRGTITMGHYTRADLQFYYALADAFTICDNYRCSSIGGTDINRIIAFSGTMDPDGFDGGAQFLDTRLTDRVTKYGFTFGAQGRWITYPQQLQAKGITWKHYGTALGQALDNVLLYWKAYQDPTSPLAQRAFSSLNPGPYLTDFTLDCLSGSLPQVSWIVANSDMDDEHPPGPVEWGQDFVAHVIAAVTGNPTLWAKTAIFITYDENGGFFDHVPPVTSPPSTPGEHIPKPALGSQAYIDSGNGTYLDPIGLGFRVPMLIVSPFTRGGLICSDLFDHTSMLKFLERRFGAEIPGYDPAQKRPGISTWRRGITGDLTSAFNFAAAPDPNTPVILPATNRADPRVLTECFANGEPGQAFSTSVGAAYPLPATQSMPSQEPLRGSIRRPSGLPVAAASAAGAGATTPAPSGVPNTSPAPSAGELIAGAVLVTAAWWARRRNPGSRPEA